MSYRQSNRRQFLKRSLQVTGSAALPAIWLNHVDGAKPTDRLGVGCIGVGGRGTFVSNIAYKMGRKVACADVDRLHAQRFTSNGAGNGKCAALKDYRHLLDRKDVDVVTIGTPDHWHTKILIEAVEAGKDVYCEKPMTLTIDEGKKICQAVKKTGRIVQVGTQQRSSGQFLATVALAQSGRLGDVLTATCSLGSGPAGGPFSTTDPPAELDWDMWLGQCPMVPFTRQRCHGSFRWWLEYSGGKMTDWGAHHVDIAQWALGYANSGPVEIEGNGEFPCITDDFDPVAFFAGKAKLPNSFNTAVNFNSRLTFANGSSIVVKPGKRNGIMIEGSKGRIFINRGGVTGKPIEELTEDDRKWLAEEVTRLNKGKPMDPFNVTTLASNSGGGKASFVHMKNFFECVQDRSQPASDVFSHHRTVSSCHLCNIAMLLKRKLRWDPVAEDFIGDAQASALVSRPQRNPYSVAVR